MQRLRYLALIGVLLFPTLAHAQIAFVSGTKADCGACSSNTGLTINKPAGVSAGNILVAEVTYLNTATITSPSGWNLISAANAQANGQLTRSYCFDVTGSDPANWQWTFTANGFPSGSIAAYSGTAPCAQNFAAATHSNTNSSASSNANSITLTVANSWIVVTSGWGAPNGTTTCSVDAGVNGRENTQATNLASFGNNLADKGPLAAGATGTVNVCNPYSNSTTWASQTMDLVPSVTPTATPTPASVVSYQGGGAIGTGRPQLRQNPYGGSGLGVNYWLESR